MRSIAIRDNNLGVISSLTKNDITLDTQLRAEYKPVLWRSICSEYDSINFFNMACSLKHNYTDEFKRFLNKWLKDEAMHTAGFKKIYNFAYEISEQEIDKNLEKRKSDFSNIGEFLEDEFNICLLLAYDEIVTAHVYERSLPFYKNVEAHKLPLWIKKVKYDEVMHFLGIIDVINTRHKHNKTAAKRILTRILEIDMQQKEYEGTFVLDHSCPEFPLTKQEIMDICIKTVLKKIS